MLYGGPLGTYLSGLSTTSTAGHHTASVSPYSSNAYSGSTYLGSGLRRSNSRYRSGATTASSPSTASNSSTTGTAGTSLASSYFTPTFRRRYGPNETEPVKSVNRYITRPISRLPTSSSASAVTAFSPTASTTSPSKSLHYSRWSPSKSSTNAPSYGGSTLGTSASWNSDLSTATDDNVDYKHLYESEKVVTDELRNEVALAQKEMENLQHQIDSALQSRRSSGAEKRKMERRISECEEELKVLEKLRNESEKLRAEHRALVRVVSRLNREQ